MRAGEGEMYHSSRRQQTSRGDTADIFVIIWDKKKRNAATQQPELRAGLLEGKDNEQEPTSDNPDHVLSIRRLISSEGKKKKSTNLHYCFEDL